MSSPEFVLWRLFSNSPQVSLQLTKTGSSHSPFKWLKLCIVQQQDSVQSCYWLCDVLL